MRVLAQTTSAFLVGLQPKLVTVEVAAQIGIPGIQIVGLANKAVSEARQRIAGALQQSNIKLKTWRTVVNLAPAHLPKTGTSFDLAIVVSLLQLHGYFRLDISTVLFVGEVALDGSIRSTPGLLAMALEARKQGVTQIVCPQTSAAELAVVSDLKYVPVEHIKDLLVLGQQTVWPERPAVSSVKTTITVSPLTTFEQIAGQAVAKRVMTIAAAGAHHVLLIGPPGCGKSLLAQTVPGLLPPLSQTEQIELTQMYSAAGLHTGLLVTERPFRAPHHSLSLVGLVGGGALLRPGEITLAHRGVLFLDELAEFGVAQLESLRQPLETGRVTIVRAQGSLIYPAKCLLVAAANPCPCGWSGSQIKNCTCTEQYRIRYQQKLSGPLLDRFDLIVRLEPPEFIELQQLKNFSVERVTAQTQAAVRNARLLQPELNSQLAPEKLSRYLTTAARAFLTQASHTWQLTARGYHKIIRVAKTIANLAGKTEITPEDLAEALQYRTAW